MTGAAVTRQLAEFATGAAAPLPQPVRDEAARAFLNYVGCALGGLHEAASSHAFALADEFSGVRECTVIGRRGRLDAQHAALLNCLQSSVQTFDDTHLATVIHPTGPVAAAMMALLQHRPAFAVDGAEFLAGLAYGIEVSCRVAVALTAAPSKIALGAFTTGLTGGIGAAVGCGRLLRLDAQRMAEAIGIAAAQACGTRATHATMTGALIPALGARAGLGAAWLAARGFDAGNAALEHRNGLLAVFAPGADPLLAVQDLGSRYQMAGLSYKPYPCGIVIHPAIDACLELAPQREEPIAAVQLQVHPLALQLTGTRHPANALGCNTSLYHWVAAALLRGRAGSAEATEQVLRAGEVAALRDRIEAQAVDTLRPEEARVQVQLASGRLLAAHVAHARGSRERPLARAELAAKFLAQAQPVLGHAQAAELLASCEALPAAGAGWLQTLAARAVPQSQEER